MSDNNNTLANNSRYINNKVLIINYIKSILEPYTQKFEDFRNKAAKLFSIISNSEEVSLYVHSETLRCNHSIIGYSSTLILYYRMHDFWDTIPSHIVCEEKDECMQEVIRQFLTQIPEDDPLW
jgi:hypothetical protein